MNSARRALLAWQLLAALTVGCAFTVSVAPAPPAASTPPLRSKLPVAIDYVGVRFDGLASGVSNPLLLRIATDLRETEFFPRVFDSAHAHEAPEESLRLSLAIEQTEDLGYPLLGFLRFTLVAASLLLLDPLFPAHYDYTAALTATLTTGSGWERVYHAEASGSTRYSMFLSNPWRVGRDTRNAVMARAFELLTHEIVSDAGLAAVGGAAAPSGGGSTP